jgi:hypothetical protein
VLRRSPFDERRTAPDRRRRRRRRRRRHLLLAAECVGQQCGGAARTQPPDDRSLAGCRFAVVVSGPLTGTVSSPAFVLRVGLPNELRWASSRPLLAWFGGTPRAARGRV